MPLLAEDQFGHWDKRELGAFAENRAARSKEQVFYQLLRNGGPSANADAFQIVFSSDLHRVPIESMMLVEMSVFCGDYSMLEIGRDLAQRNVLVSFVIRGAVNPSLQAALHVDRGGRWIDPPGSHKNQHGKRPKKRDSEEKPSNEGSEKAFPTRSLGMYGRTFSHISE
jgi:hypothetical protein